MDVSRGFTFTDGVANNVTSARLHQLVESATITTDFYTTKGDASGSVAAGDQLLIYQLTSGAFRTITTQSLVTQATNGAIAANPLVIQNGLPAVGFQDNAHAWIKTNASGFGTGGLRLWDNSSSAWRRVYSVPINTIMGYVGGGSFDGTGKGTGNFDGWAMCNGNNGTTTIASVGSLNYMQFIGYSPGT